MNRLDHQSIHCKVHHGINRSNLITNLITSRCSAFSKTWIKGQFIGEGIRFMEDIIGYADENKLYGLALQLDFEKAF